MANITLTVSKVETLTPDSKAIYFEPSSEITRSLAGQFLTFIVELNDKEYRRSYSICTPSEQGLAVGVKRVPGGIVSNHFNSYLRVGSKVTVQAPAGKFTYDPQTENLEHILLIAGGSGVTPMLNILKTALVHSSTTRISMLFINKSATDVMFEQELTTLAKQHAERFTLVHHLDDQHVKQIKVKKKGIAGFFGAKEQQKVPGFITKEQLEKHFENLGVSKQTHAFICGPGGLMNLAEQSLLMRGLLQAQVKKENFVPNTQVRPEPDFTPTPCTAEIKLNGTSHSIEIASGKSILQAAVEQGVDMPFSCREGTCTSCYGTCSSGEVGMLTDEALTDEELNQGAILPCVAYPKSKKLVMTVG